MSKRMTKEQRRQQEIAAIECELRLIAQGAAGLVNVEDDPENGVFIVSTVGIQAFSNYLSAVKEIWGIGREDDNWPNGFKRWMMDVCNLGKWESLSSGAEFLHEHGARSGGEWVE